MWKTYRSWLIMAPVALAVVFAGTRSDDHRRHVTRDLRVQGIRARLGLVSRLVDDWRGLRRHYRRRRRGVECPHPRGDEPGPGWYGFFVAVPVFAIALILLIPILRNRARGELQRMSSGDRRLCLHRMDVRTPGLSRERHQRLRICLLRRLCDGVE